MRTILNRTSVKSRDYLDCDLYVRENTTVVVANEAYYRFIGINSGMPITELVGEDAAEALRTCEKPVTEPLEFITTIDNKMGEVHEVYLRFENSTRREKEGVPLFHVVLFDFRDLKDRNIIFEELASKYRNFLGWTGFYFFEYTVSTGKFIIYKYVEEKSVVVVNMTLDEYIDRQKNAVKRELHELEQLNRLKNNLMEGMYSFEMDFTNPSGIGEQPCSIKARRMPKNQDKIIGVIIPAKTGMEVNYYLRPEARDAATGVFNKRAAAEYTIAQIKENDGRSRWFVMLDIDDFKNINDTYGHLFGDMVIQKVADTLRNVVGNRGIIGRFGGDEFYIFFEDVPSRDKLKVALKTMARSVLTEFQPNFELTLSIGVSNYPTDGTDYETLMSKADKALYIAKEKGKNRHIIYEDKLHGDFELDNKKLTAVSYSISSEKRRNALAQIMCDLQLQGSLFLKDKKNLEKICEVLDLDAITIYVNGEGKALCSAGKYPGGAPAISEFMKDSQYWDMFGEDGVCVENKVAKLVSVHPTLYTALKKHDIGAMIQCADKVGDDFGCLVSFDVLESGRKWNNPDIEILTVIGKVICNLVTKKPRD